MAGGVKRLGGYPGGAYITFLSVSQLKGHRSPLHRHVFMEACRQKSVFGESEEEVTGRVSCMES